MCRKDFIGYSCGHCSVPIIRACPLTRDNPRFPPCKFIAELPTLVETFCDPCRRVAFTQDVLLKEKLHMEEHQNRRCPCGNDLTEEERQQTRARLLVEKERGKGVGQVTRSVSGMRQETHQLRKQLQGDYPRLYDKQKSGQQQHVPGYMGHLNQYLNAPYGQHPMQPIPTPQPHHPYHPQHAFIGLEVSSMSQYRGKRRDFPLVNDMIFNTEPVMNFGQPFIDTQETRIVEAPDPYSAEDQPVQELPGDHQVLFVPEVYLSDTVKITASPVVVSSGIVPPPRPKSCPTYEAAKHWDTKSK
jgi:hypothetical protein